MMFQKKAQINIIQIGKKLLTKHAKGSYEVKYQLPQACNFIKKETLAQMFSCEFCETSNNTFLKNTSGRLLLKPQYGITREVAKISALSTGRTDKFEYLAGEEISPSNQRQTIKQAKFGILLQEERF